MRWLIGVSPSGKAAAFGAATRGFESLHPSHSVQLDSDDIDNQEITRYFDYLIIR